MGPEELNSDTRGLIDALKAGERPREKAIGQALEDIFASKKYRTAVVRGMKPGGVVDVPQQMMCVRFITVKGSGDYESSVVTYPPFEQRSREFIDKLHRDLDSLPVDSGLVVPILPILEELIGQQGLTVIAAQHLSRVVATKQERGSVLYPKVFRNIPMPFIQESQRDSLGLAMATGVLKMVPFGRHPVSFRLPAR